MKEDVEACRQAGMDAYLAKPIHLRQLQETLAKFAPEHPALESGAAQRATRVSFSRQPDAGQPGEREAVSNADDEPETNVIDLGAAASRVPGGLPGVRRLAEVFLGECRDLMTALRRDIPDGDPATVQRSAHTLKGSASLFAARSVQEVAARIEAKAKESDLQATPPMLAELEHEVDEMLSALNRFLNANSE